MIKQKTTPFYRLLERYLEYAKDNHRDYKRDVTIQELLEHKTIAMTKRYSQPTPEHKKKAVELVSIDTSSDSSTQQSGFSKTGIVNVTNINYGDF